MGDPDAGFRAAGRAVGRARRFSALPRRRRDRLIVLEARRALAPTANNRPSRLELIRGWIARVRDRHHTSRGEAGRPSAGPSPEPVAAPVSPSALELLAAMRGLPAQQREAWALCELERLGDIDAAGAMDCSRAALARHLELASASLRAILGDRLDAACDALRADADRLNAPPAPRTTAQSPARWPWRWIAATITAVALTAGAGWLIIRALTP
ncbi:MAG: hypothetical protein D6693_06035 [Planctomycetota bacterium]|nr:MAG: hypothetical protein D6693_06035 [Planctomycetota bacterium]